MAPRPAVVASLPRILQALEQRYGRPQPPRVTDPFEQALWENIAYLATDEKRTMVFAALRQRIGTRPQQILKATDEELLAVTRLAGTMPELAVRKLRQCAEVAHFLFQGDTRAQLRLPFQQARQAMRKFPSIGEPGAEKILLFAGAYPVLALDSNALRVLQRLGYGEARKGYAASYRATQAAVGSQVGQDCTSLMRAHQLLRQHGKETCKRTRPLCHDCPLSPSCRYFRSQS